MTHLEVTNSAAEAVLAYITLGATLGCVQDVSSLICTEGVEITELHSLMGSFTLLPGVTTRISAPEGMGLNGNFSFNTPPLNCPCPDFPEGVNLAEFIINNGFQPGGQETVDISGVCGANAFLRFELSAGDWTSNGGAIAVSSIANVTRYKNTGIVGVFPYGCDNCTSSDNPPSCVGQHPEYANADPICNVQRPASGNQGGTVRVVFVGFTPVPLEV